MSAVDFRQRLRELARFESSGSPVVSVYLNTEWVDEHQRERVRIFVKNALAFETPYWLVPDGPGRKAYALLREALEESGRVGIGTIVIRERERLLALRPAGPGLMLTTMRFASELRAVDELDMPQPAAASKKELALALQLVETLAGPFKPEQYHDAYTEALRAVIEAKIEGKEVGAPKTSRPPRVVSLVDALRKSLAAPRAAGQAKTAVRKRARRREKKAA